MTDQPADLASALVALQASLPHVTKDAENPHFRSRYATLAALTDALFPVMAKFGLSFTAKPTIDPDLGFVLLYALRHVNGDIEPGAYPLPASGTPQQIGSAITYGRRYCLCAVTGLVADDDDDGNAASQPDTQKPASAGLSAEQRESAGMMTTAQRAAHTRLKNIDKPTRPADRGPLEQDPWVGQPPGTWEPGEPEQAPGSSNAQQHRQLGILFRQLGIDERADRLAEMTSRTGRQISSAKDLSYAEAEKAIKELAPLAAEIEKGGRT